MTGAHLTPLWRLLEHGRRAAGRARRPLAHRRAGTLPSRPAPRRAGAQLPHAALAGQRQRGACATGAQDAGAAGRCTAGHRAGAAVARRDTAVCRTRAGRPGRDGRAPPRAGGGRLRQCRPAALPARARHRRGRRAAHAAGRLEPPAVVDRAGPARLASTLARAPGRGQSAPADDLARECPPRHGHRLCAATCRTGPPRRAGRQRRRPLPFRQRSRGADRALPRPAIARLRRGRGLRAGRRRPGRRTPAVVGRAAAPGRACAGCLRRARREDRAPAGTGRTGPAGTRQRPAAPGARAGHPEPPAPARRAEGR